MKDGGSASEGQATGGAPGRVSRVERVYRQGVGAPGADADAVVAGTAGSMGAALPAGPREKFEASLGTDLGGVRVHTGAASADAAAGLGARAFATGQDIHFGAGQFRPDDPFGMHLLAHEVAHTVQQGSGGGAGGGAGAGGVQMKLEVSEPGDALEVEADRAADAMVSGAPAAVTGGAAPRVARQVAGEGAADEAGEAAPAASAAPADPNAAAMLAYATTLANGEGARVPEVAPAVPVTPADKKKGADVIRQPKSQANDVHPGEESGNAALTGYSFVRDPFDNTVTAVRPDGTGVQYTFQVAKAEAEGGAPSVTLSRTEELSPMRVKALKRLDKAGLQEAQEGATGPAGRKAQDHANGDKARQKWADEHPAEMAAYREQMKAWTDGGSTGTPPAPPKGYPGDKKTTLCTNLPGDVYQSAGGSKKQSFPFSPPTGLPSWRTLASNPEGPRPGDIYYLWDLVKNQAAHMGVFRSATPIDGQEDMQTWVVTDGGQGTYEGVQMIHERTRGPFNRKTGIFSSSIAEAGQSKGDRKLTGWVDIDAHNAANPPAP